MHWVSDERRRYAIIAECAKVIGNSSFGRTIMDKSKHENIKYANENNTIILK